MIDPKRALSAEIAIRSRSLDWLGQDWGPLPDPDPVLRAAGVDADTYRALLADPHVWACVQSRKAGTLQAEWEIVENPGAGRRAGQAAAGFVREIFKNLDLRRIFTDILEAPLWGFSPLEVIWTIQAGRWMPSNVIGRPAEWFVFDTQNRPRFLSRDDMVNGELLPPMKFLLAGHYATYKNPYGERLLSRVFWPVTFKRAGFKFWAVFTEKFGMPWVIGKVPREATDVERGKILDALAQMVQDAVAVINDDENVDLREPAGKTASADVYDKLITASNQEISKAVLGQTLTTEVGDSGSRALGEVQAHVRSDLVEQDKLLVADTLNVLIRWICRLNFNHDSAPGFGWREAEDLQLDRAERDQKLSGQLESSGFRLSRAYFMRSYGLSDEDLEDVEGTEANDDGAPEEEHSEFSGKSTVAVRSYIRGGVTVKAHTRKSPTGSSEASTSKSGGKAAATLKGQALVSAMESKFKNEYGVEHIDLYNNVQIARYLEKYAGPAVEAGLKMPKQILVVFYKNRPGEIASYWNTEHDTILLNRACLFFRAPVTRTKKMIKERHLSGKGPGHILIHELMHREHTKALKVSLPKAKLPILTLWEVSLLNKYVSTYASKSGIEAVAEIGAGHLAGKKYPPEIWEIYDKQKGPKKWRGL